MKAIWLDLNKRGLQKPKTLYEINCRDYARPPIHELSASVGSCPLHELATLVQ